MNIRILLLQARYPSDSARIDEHSSFARQAALDIEQIVPYDLLTSTPSIAEIQQYDALMIGGSGDFYVSKGNLPGHEDLLHTLREVVDVGHPTFASCFGFQLMVAALDGEISYDERNMEVGTYQLTLTEAGQSDELFNRLPFKFLAQLGHKDRVEIIPPAVLNLATSVNSLSQSIRIPGKPIWATQFHPELSAKENLRRFRQYISGYASMMEPEEIEEILARFKESPETDALIPGFLELVFD
ncbi:MAG: type 1 glutamine amidotransferase [Candidatus Promineifilaceae bacterium]